ncbi:MAG: photosynthetic reaction center cytochrome c subunit [Anaerolineaceae bacterium]|nr:photosynthetic reaction center cytochrome c subunit [Anaerolineaceae bacterium]
MRRGFKNPYGPNLAFWAVFLAITVLLLSGALWVLSFVRGTVVSAAEDEITLNQAYINYSTSGDYVATSSLTAVQAYIAEFPEPQNVQVLTGMTTSEIWSFMTTYVAGGMKVDCTYCHNVANFAADGAEIGDDVVAARKDNARQHLQMVADLNQNWLTQLADIEGKQPSGAQIICATCHLAEPLPVAWPENLHALPDEYRLPLDDLDVLLVTGNLDVSLDAVQYNQHTMYHMSESLGVGCTHCHNSRYFPDWEQPAKYYALTMLQMSQYIRENYQDSMNGQEPSCFLCHRNQVRPPGAVQAEVFLPDVLTSSYAP